MMTYAELESFFTGLVATAQARGIVCGITSGMACVHFGVAATTKDCDVLCAADSAADFLDLIAATEVRGVQPMYRGNLSPPLDACRIRIYERALRPYVSAVRRATARRALTLRDSHLLRVECAGRSLTPEPVREYGAARLADEARADTARLIHPSLMKWLPEVGARVILPTP